jgi:hypothetical protein
MYIILIYVSYKVCGIPMTMITGHAFNHEDREMTEFIMHDATLLLFTLTFMVVSLILYVLRIAIIAHEIVFSYHQLKYEATRL